MATLHENQEALLREFSAKMKAELSANIHKGDITAWQASAYDFIAETAYHIAKLTKAMLEVERGGNEQSRNDVDEFAADVANFMAKTSQQFGTLRIK